jgi:hypothetical protein
MLDGVPRIVFELYGIARRRAGVESLAGEGATLREGLLALARSAPALEGDVIVAGRLGPHWRASLAGGRFLEDDDQPLPDDARVVLLTSLAGG